MIYILMCLLQVWAVKSHVYVVLNSTMFHMLMLRLPARSAPVTKKLDVQIKDLDAQIPGSKHVSNLKEPLFK